MAYVDVNFYKDEYLNGKSQLVDDVVFPFFARKAENYIKKYTFGRINEMSMPLDVKMCCCELTELFFQEDREMSAFSPGIKAEKVGEYSVSYDDKISVIFAYGQKKKVCIEEWLLSLGLLYCGV